MEVYLVRHGETDGNLAHRHQHPETGLNQRGLAQSAAVAQVIARVKPTHIITSTNLRAVASAELISEKVDLIPETYPEFEELRQSRTMIGERLTGLRALSYMIAWFAGRESASMHDGETYAAFVVRLALARKHLEELPADSRVVIVSHSIFITFFVEHMRHPKRMNLGRAMKRFTQLLCLKNSSITHVRYTRTATPDTGWTLIKR